MKMNNNNNDNNNNNIDSHTSSLSSSYDDAFSGEHLVKSITDHSSMLIPQDVRMICDQAYDQYFANGCGCARKCHKQFPRYVAFEAHLDALHLDQYCQSHVNHQHLLLLGAMNALVKNHAIAISKKSMFFFVD